MASEMKLSDAIETGWKRAPQSWDLGYGTRNPSGAWAGVCAVGAAILGADPEIEEKNMVLETGGQLFPQLYNQVPVAKIPPECVSWFEETAGSLSLSDVIQYLNDQANRPGSEIVAYLRQLGY